MAMPFHHPFQENQFDIFEWYPKYQSCLRFFLSQAQYTDPVRAVAAYINIKLPCQKAGNSNTAEQATELHVSSPVLSSPNAGQQPSQDQQAAFLIPYVRRLVATSFDSPAVLHGFFGEDWEGGVGPLHEAERRNYLFAAKSDAWLAVKSHYDMDDGQFVPFLRPPQNVTMEEIESAETSWSEWLAMQDWMLGPRAPGPETGGPSGTPRGTRSRRDRS